MKKMKNGIKKLNKYTVPFLAVCIAMIIITEIYVYSKYYTLGHQKGVAIASGFYFTSNYLTDIKSETGLSAEDIDETQFDKFHSVNNVDTWDGNSPYKYELKIRNYENQLLYNDENIDLEYSIYFRLETAPTDGSKYSVSYIDDEGNQVVKELSTDTFSLPACVLKGGEANNGRYIIEIKPQNASTYTPVGVAVWAEPDSPVYLKKNCLLAGMLRAVISTSSGEQADPVGRFNISGQLVSWEQADIDAINNMAALNYTITTLGIDEGSFFNVNLHWSTKLEINKFDDHILNNTFDVFDKDNRNVTLKIAPYSSVTITFYKTKDFILENIGSLDNFNSLVNMTYTVE